MTIIISDTATAAEFEAVLAAFPEITVERGDFTCVDASDELRGVTLLSSVHDVMSAARGEVWQS